MRRTDRPLLVGRQSPHKPFRHVLVAVDSSPWSREASTLARRVAPHAHLAILRVFQVQIEENCTLPGSTPPVPLLVPLLRLVYLRFTRAAGVLGRIRRRDQRGI